MWDMDTQARVAQMVQEPLDQIDRLAQTIRDWNTKHSAICATLANQLDRLTALLMEVGKEQGRLSMRVDLLTDALHKKGGAS